MNDVLGLSQMKSWNQEIYLNWELSKDDKEAGVPLKQDQTSWDNIILIYWQSISPCLASYAENPNQNTILFICYYCSIFFQYVTLIIIRMASSLPTKQSRLEKRVRGCECLFSVAAPISAHDKQICIWLSRILV